MNLWWLQSSPRNEYKPPAATKTSALRVTTRAAERQLHKRANHERRSYDLSPRVLMPSVFSLEQTRSCPFFVRESAKSCLCAVYYSLSAHLRNSNRGAHRKTREHLKK